MEERKMQDETGQVKITMDESPIVEELKKRIWACNAPMNVVQLRNSITDMYMLKFLTLGEYILLNNEIDSFIGYAIQHGVGENAI